MIVHMESEREARLLGSRSITVKHIWRYWADAPAYALLHEKVKKVEDVWTPYASSRDTTWKFHVATFGRTIPGPEQVKVIETFAYMKFLGPIQLEPPPEVLVGVFEEYDSGCGRQVRERDTAELRHLWMGLKVSCARANEEEGS